MSEKETPNILRRASDVLGERGWCKGTLSDDEGRVCAMGALEVAVLEYLPRPSSVPASKHNEYFNVLDRHIDIQSEAVVAMAEVLEIPCMDDEGMPGNPIPDWNDAPDRTAEEVILTMKSAAQYIEERRESADPC